MNAGKSPLEPGYVIHRRAYGDTSLIVDLITPMHGRISVLAKGVKRGKAQRALLLQPFRSLHLSWSGRGELPYLSTAEEAGRPLTLKGEALACAYYVNELIYRLVPKHEPAPDLFAHYWQTLKGCMEENTRSSTLRQFEIALLEQIGFAPQFDHDIESGELVRRDMHYLYKVPDGPVVNPDTVSDASDTNLYGVDSAQPTVAVSGQTLLCMSARDFSSVDTCRESLRLTRALIHHHLDGRELMSRMLFRTHTRTNNNHPSAANPADKDSP